MSAYSVAFIECDGTTPRGYHCGVTFDVGTPNLAQTRDEAEVQGWETRKTVPGMGRKLRDFCREHTAQAWPASTTGSDQT